MSAPSKMVNTHRRRRAAIAIAIGAMLAIGAGASLAIAVTASSNGPVPPTSEAAPANAVEPALASGVSLMRRAQNAADVVPASVPVVFSQSSGANIALARRVADGAGAEAWVIPGNGTTCILARLAQYDIGGAVCTSTAAALAGELDVQSASAQLPGAELVAGIVPDSVGAVTMTLADGGTASAAVHENVYLALVHGAVASISATGPQGQIAVPAMSASSASARLAGRG